MGRAFCDLHIVLAVSAMSYSRCLLTSAEVSMAAMTREFALLPFLLMLMLPAAIVTAQNANPSAADAVYPIREGYVNARGVMIYYKSFGRGKPMMLLHGGPGASHDYFLPYLTPLARH